LDVKKVEMRKGVGYGVSKNRKEKDWKMIVCSSFLPPSQPMAEPKK
jgi:hypothetical protein